MTTHSELFDVRGYGVAVTGAASGLGLAYAEVMAEHGACVTLIDVDEPRLRREAERLGALGHKVGCACVDVRDHPSLERAIDAAAHGAGRLDAVFANAGVDPGPGFLRWSPGRRERNPEGALERYSDERWNRVLDINLGGVFATVRAAARCMRPARRGRIIVTTSLSSTRVGPAIGAAYMAAKAGARHFVQCAALELAAEGITVNAIAPGFFVTDIGGGHARDPELQAGLAREIPMHRVAFPDDIKGLALFLASPASAYITGQGIVIDGGWGLGVAD